MAKAKQAAQELLSLRFVKEILGVYLFLIFVIYPLYYEDDFKEAITEDKLSIVRDLNEIAQERGQSLAQMAVAWDLRLPEVTSALIGASRPEQVIENIKALDNLAFTQEELDRIDGILARKNW